MYVSPPRVKHAWDLGVPVVFSPVRVCVFVCGMWSVRVFVYDLSDNFFELLKGPNPYLDKPHMHFWLSAISFKIFGLYEWTYRIPALLFTALGAYSIYQLTKKLYFWTLARFWRINHGFG